MFVDVQIDSSDEDEVEIMRVKNYDEIILSKNQINLPKPELFQIFTHVHYLEIHCRYHPFSLDSLISVITGTTINEVMVKGDWLSSVIESNEFVKENWRFEFDGSKRLEIKLM